MRPRTCALLLAAALVPALAGCSGIRTDIEADRAVDFRRFRTYAWGSHEGASTPAVDRRIRSAIDAQLVKKGLVRVEQGGDLEVRYRATVDPVYEVIAWEHGSGPRWGGMPAQVELREASVGAIQIDLIERASQRRAFRVRGVAHFSADPGPDERAARVDEAAPALFRSFPRTAK